MVATATIATLIGCGDPKSQAPPI